MIYPSNMLVVVRDHELLVSVEGQQWIKPMTGKNFLWLAIQMLEAANQQIQEESLSEEEKKAEAESRLRATQNNM